MGVAALSLHIPTTAADTTDEWYITCPFPGTWRIIGVEFAPATAVTADNTNYCLVVLSTNSARASTTWTALGSISTEITGTAPAVGAAMVIGTARNIPVSGAGVDISQGRQIRVVKTDPGTGAVLDGTFTFALEKIN